MLVDNTYPPTREVSKAIKRKTLCADSIPASGSLKQNESLTGLFNYMWTQENLLKLLKVASNNDLYKGTGTIVKTTAASPFHCCEDFGPRFAQSSQCIP